MSEKYYLIGEKLAHSYSAEIHKEFGYSYELKELKKEEVGSFLCEKKFAGLNVTIPYKKEVIQYLDELDVSAEAVGAVNTIVNRNGKLVGYNTDVYGMTYLMKNANIDVNGKVVSILGSGGTSNIANYVAKSLGAKLTRIISRSNGGYDDLTKISDTEIIINTTPVGMYPNVGKAAIDISGFDKLIAVVDAIYNPKNTEIIFDAQEKGIIAVSGLKMLVAQAKKARDIFLGNEIDNDIIEKIYNKLLKNTLNVVLIGMPSSGKSTIGKALANKLNREFIDSDAIIENRENRSIKEIFATEGEKYFRNVEKSVVEDITKGSAQVIATGGGAIMNDNAYRAMRRNSIIVYLVSARTPDREGRPLLMDESAYNRLLKERISTYERISDIIIENNDSVEVVVDRIMEKICQRF